MVVFIKSFSGKGKESGKEFQCLTLAELRKGKNGLFDVFVKEFFVDPKMNCNCDFGDVVEVKWSEGGFGGSVRPVELSVVKESPYLKIFKE